MAEYIKREMPDMNGTGERKAYYKIKTYSNLRSEEFINKICYPGSGLNKGDVSKVMCRMVDEMKRWLAEGHTITIDELGTFSLSIGVMDDNEVEDFEGNGKKVNAKRIGVRGVNFRPEKQMVKDIARKCKLHKGYDSPNNRSPYTREERLKMAQDYIAEHHFMRVRDYEAILSSSLNCCQRVARLLHTANRYNVRRQREYQGVCETKCEIERKQEIKKELMRYLGSKESLTEPIIQLLAEKGLLQRNLVFFDAFCGMGSVSDAIKSSYDHVVINDSLKCSSTFALGKLYAHGCNFEKLGFDPFVFLNSNQESRRDFIYENYSPGGSDRMYFSAENAGRIDYFRFQIGEWRKEGLINDHEYVYLLACLMESVSDVSNTAGVYGAFLKHWDSRAKKPIVFSRIDAKDGFCPNVDYFNDKIENIIGDVECDILYLDPPYTQNQYGTQYHLLETLILNDNPTISKVTGSRPTGPMRSDWSKMYHAHILFDKVVAETKASHVILSYNNDGFMSKEFIESTLRRYGVEDSFVCIAIDYKKYNNTKCQGAEGHQEYLFYIEKKPIKDVVVESPLNYTGSKSKMVEIIRKHLPKQPFDTLVDAFGGGFNVGINIPSKETIYNDINPFVEGLIKSFSGDVYSYLMYVSKLINKYSLSPDNKEGYLALRKKYNETPINKRDPRMLYTLILYGFQQQIRFNTSHEFNNPAGSRWFNECLLSKFITFARCSKQKNVEYCNLSFDKLIDRVTTGTLVYADPPYRSTLGVYNDGKRGFEGWTIKHEQNLCLFLDKINELGSRFMLSYVLRVDDFYNKEIAEWAANKHYNVIDVETPQGRYNNRREVLITNY